MGKKYRKERGKRDLECDAGEYDLKSNLQGNLKST